MGGMPHHTGAESSLLNFIIQVHQGAGPDKVRIGRRHTTNPCHGRVNVVGTPEQLLRTVRRGGIGNAFALTMPYHPVSSRPLFR